jgi:branched-chain amino acid transport system ATP-binding protein
MSTLPTTSVLELRGLKRAFGGIKAVDGIDLAIPETTTVALIGPNGAGKSTLFGLLSGEERPTEGDILLDGESIVRLPTHARTRLGLGRSFQVSRVFNQLSVRQNARIALVARDRRMRDLARSAASLYHDEIAGLLAEVHLGGKEDRLAASLSQAEKKRLELAMVLALSPRLLLLDEPTAGMGLDERAALMTLVADAVRRRSLTMLFTEHDMDVVFSHASRIIVMDHGRIVADGTAAEIRDDPVVTEIYLGRYVAQADR